VKISTTCAFLVIKIFFSIFKSQFCIFIKRFLQAGGIIEPHVEIYFYKRFSVTRLWKSLFPQAKNAGGLSIRL